MLPIARPFFIACLAVAAVAAARADDWPQWRGPNRDGVWGETGIVEKFSSSELQPDWRVQIGSGYCGPTVAKGRVYLMDLITRPTMSERVHCFDEKTGNPLWSYQ